MKIFLDVDDTLANFRDHAVALGVPPWTGTWYTTDPATWSQEQKDIQKATNDLMRTESFWLTMPTTKGAFELIAAAASRADTYLLTAMPSFAKDEPTQKMIRAAKLEYACETLHFPESRVIICQRPDKVKHAVVYSASNRRSPNILVDDARQNCAEWDAAGGVSILHEHSVLSIRGLKTAFAE